MKIAIQIKFSDFLNISFEYCPYIKIFDQIIGNISYRRFGENSILPLENLDTMHDLLRIMKIQNELLENANKKFSDETLPKLYSQPLAF